MRLGWLTFGLAVCVLQLAPGCGTRKDVAALCEEGADCTPKSIFGPPTMPAPRSDGGPTADSQPAPSQADPTIDPEMKDWHPDEHRRRDAEMPAGEEYCPPFRAPLGSPCDPLAVCFFDGPFGVLTTCSCLDRRWTCRSAGCPSQPPEPSTGCPGLEASTCSYGPYLCMCTFGGWECG